jgi:DNA-directed RNA polymerase subunit RPC12/RpoP
MPSICPGQDRRWLKAEIFACPNCGTKVEIFSNEMRVKCYHCGNVVSRERMPSCVDWCPGARECIGEQRWKELKGDA